MLCSFAMAVTKHKGNAFTMSRKSYRSHWEVLSFHVPETFTDRKQEIGLKYLCNNRWRTHIFNLPHSRQNHRATPIQEIMREKPPSVVLKAGSKEKKITLRFISTWLYKALLKAQLFWQILRRDKKIRTYVNFSERTQCVAKSISGIYSK